MKIVVTKDGKNCYTADRPQMGGSPCVGRGKTSKEALGDLIYNDMKSFNIELELPQEEYDRIYSEFEKSR